LGEKMSLNPRLDERTQRALFELNKTRRDLYASDGRRAESGELESGEQ
jgi:hypothetical protein